METKIIRLALGKHVLPQTNSFNQQKKWLHRGMRLECVEKKEIFHTMRSYIMYVSIHTDAHGTRPSVYHHRYIRSMTMFSKHRSHYFNNMHKLNQLFKHFKHKYLVILSLPLVVSVPR